MTSTPSAKCRYRRPCFTEAPTARDSLSWVREMLKGEPGLGSSGQPSSACSGAEARRHREAEALSEVTQRSRARRRRWSCGVGGARSPCSSVVSHPLSDQRRDRPPAAQARGLRPGPLPSCGCSSWVTEVSLRSLSCREPHGKRLNPDPADGTCGTMATARAGEHKVRHRGAGRTCTLTNGRAVRGAAPPPGGRDRPAFCRRRGLCGLVPGRSGSFGRGARAAGTGRSSAGGWKVGVGPRAERGAGGGTFRFLLGKLRRAGRGEGGARPAGA